jgi:signal transduction histidine kinase
VEEWLARNDVGSPVSGRTLAGDHAVDRLTTEGADDHSSLLRSITGTQFVIDVVIAVAFGVLGVVAGIVDGGALAVLAIFTIAVVFRRVSPLLALGIAWLGAGIQLALSLSVVVSDIAILLVLYATAAFGGRFTRWAGLASAGVGALVAATYLVVIGSGPLPIDVMQRPEFLTSTATNFLTLLVASAGVLGLAWTLGFLVRTWRRARQSRAQAARAMEEQRAAQRDVVVEQERNRIARDMHDVVAHSLAVVIAQADGARYARATDPTAVDGALTTIASTAREALGDVRILLAQLRKDEAQGPQPVLADLDRLREQMRSAGLDIRWTESGTQLPLGTGAQLAVYRIVQEAFTNALRHGKPDTAVHASLRWDDTGVLATVENEVRADEADDQPAGVGHGLPGMRERALLAGGTLTVETPPGRFRVVARIPATGPTATGTTAAADATEGAQA